MRNTILRTGLVLAAVAVPLGAWLHHELLATRAPHVSTPKLTIGAYASPRTVADAARWRAFLARADTTALNAVVLDLMTPTGIHFRGEGRLARRVAAPAGLSYDLVDRVAEAHAHRLFVVGRVDVSRNPRLARAKPKWTLRTRAGHPWLDRSGRTSLDVGNDAFCRFLAGIAREAAQAGVDEVMLDNLRLPGAAGPRLVRADAREPAYRAVAGCARAVGVSVRRAGARLGVAVPARVCSDVSVAGVEGQRWEDLALAADRLSPEVYPSSLPALAGPAMSPYAAVTAVVAPCYTRNLRLIRDLGGKPVRVARIEPWIQAYSARGWNFGPVALGEELRALREHGVGNALLWNGESDFDRFVPALRRGMAGRVVAYNPSAAEWALANRAPQGIRD